MQYQPGNPASNQLTKLISLLIVLLFPTVTAFPRNRDMVKDNKGILTNKEALATMPPLARAFPKSLQIGAYTIIVESYDKGGVWNTVTKTFDHLNGKGRIKFNCPGSHWVKPGIWKEATMKPVFYKVVDKAKVRDNEISTRDIALLGIQAQPGSDVELMMPHFNGKVIDMSGYVKKMTRKTKNEGIPVIFTDLSVKINKPKDSKGTVLSGIAKYPAGNSLKLVPLTVNIFPGFQLEINSIGFTPTMDPIVDAKLLLPASLTQNSDCARGSIDLVDIRLNPNCEFYKEYPAAKYGVFGVGNTTLAIGGKGYVVDFSSTQSYASSGKPANWKGVILLAGESKGIPSGTSVSNIGYLQAPYSFINGIVESSGLEATFNLASPYKYNTTQPFGYMIDFNSATLNVSSSLVSGGTIRNGNVTLPRTAVRQADDSPVVVSYSNLDINASMDLQGNAIIRPDICMYWGDLIKAGGGDRKSFGASNITRQVRIFFAAEPRPPFIPVTPNGKEFNFPFSSISASTIESLNMQGATFGNFTVLVVNTPDIPGGPSWNPNKPDAVPTDNAIWYRLTGKEQCWINVVTEGVHCHIDGQIVKSKDLKLGDNNKPLYVGIIPFVILNRDDSTRSHILLQCVESAVINCDYQSSVGLPEPVKTVMAFKEMVFTSTANNAGGKLVVGSNDSLSYWGLELVPKPGFSSAGLISVKTGQIIITAAGLAERRHFIQPFWLTWGEMLANGSMGRLFFDYNSAGQQFDHFNYIHDAVALSQYVSGRNGFLRVGGTAFFPFFGGDYLHIKDTYDKSRPDHPYYSRNIELSNETLTGFAPSDLKIYGNWSDGLGIFNFDIKYAAITQDGFLGTGTSALQYLSGGNISSALDMNSRGTSIRIGSNLMDQRSVSLGPVANISNITRIWGCVYINGDGIDNIVVGGEVTNAANVSVAARVGSYLAATLQIKPSLARLTIDGEAYISIMASVDADINGHMQLTLNHAAGFVEGEVLGKVRVIEGAVLIGSSLEAEGQLNWHLGVDFNELQGMVSIKVMGYGGGGGVGAGFYIGVNAPKNRAWVLLGKDPRYKLNMTPMPDNLTGVYGFIHVNEGINLYIISGGYDFYLGFGVFLDPGPLVVGNLGGRIYGDILGGLVSASGYFDLQLLLGIDRFGFQGTVGLEACVLWVICGSVDLTLGLNKDEGFYIR